jgi:uncharacterized protein
LTELTPLLLLGYAITGLVAGTLGGLIGIGGGVIVVPALTLIFHKDAQLAVAASLFQMIFIATSSAYGHWRNGYILKGVVERLVPIAVCAAVAGALFGSRIPGSSIMKIFAVFLLYTSIDTGYRLVGKLLRKQAAREAVKEFTPKNSWTIPTVSVAMGFSCGVLGIGGGAIAVPMLNKFLDLPMKNAIANSSAAIFFLSIVATATKLAYTIFGTVMIHSAEGGMRVLHWYDILIVGGLLAPTSFVGGRIGAHLTKIAPTRVIQGIFILVMLYSAYDMWTKSEKKPAPAAVPAAMAPANPGQAAPAVESSAGR